MSIAEDRSETNIANMSIDVQKGQFWKIETIETVIIEMKVALLPLENTLKRCRPA